MNQTFRGCKRYEIVPYSGVYTMPYSNHFHAGIVQTQGQSGILSYRIHFVPASCKRGIRLDIGSLLVARNFEKRKLRESKNSIQGLSGYIWDKICLHDKESTTCTPPICYKNYYFAYCSIRGSVTSEVAMTYGCFRTLPT